MLSYQFFSISNPYWNKFLYPSATIKQVNSDPKKYDKNLVMIYNIPLDYTVD